MATNDENNPDSKLTYEQIMALSKNMYEKMLIMDGGNFRKLDPAKDTKSAYFHKSDIDALFAAHPGSNGLKIYFGVHDSAIAPVKQPGYHNKLMAALVSTTDEVDNVDKHGTQKLMLGGGNTSKICPPDTNCN